MVASNNLLHTILFNESKIPFYSTSNGYNTTKKGCKSNVRGVSVFIIFICLTFAQFDFRDHDACGCIEKKNVTEAANGSYDAIDVNKLPFTGHV